LPLHFDEKPHKPSFFMHKKSLSRFNIMKQLGSGTYSDSFLCIEKKSNAIFCLKRFHKATIKNFPEVLDSFVKKIAFQFLSDHPNIVQLYDIFCDV
jgi:serine/threonine protein kinase